MPRKKNDPEPSAILEFRGDDGPKGSIRVTEPAAVKALLDGQRQRLLRHFVAPASVKEAAEKLNDTPARLYYHVRLLEKHGLIKAVGERRAGSNTEKLYQLAAKRFEVVAELQGIAAAAGGATASLVNTAARYGAALDRPPEPGAKGVRAVREIQMRLPHARAEAFWKRLSKFLEDFDAEVQAAGHRDTAPRYGVHVIVVSLGDDENDKKAP